MHLSKFYAGLGLLAGMATAMPHSMMRRQAPGAQNVVYWGQNGGGTVERSLSAYCESGAGIDIIVLSFLYQWGNGVTYPSGVMGQSCYVSTSGEGQNCDNLASEIATCQAAGIKIIISLGGASGSYSLQSDAQAAAIGQNLWESYGNSGNTTAPRPFGSTFVNGWDFDIENDEDGSSQYYPAMISQLRSNFASDPSNTYYITGAPQCPIPEPNMGVIIQNAKFDYLWVQFYNNNNYTVPCALGINGDAPFNYNNWTNFVSTTQSAGAKIFIGVPASQTASTGTGSGAVYYATPEQLATIVAEYKSKPDFGGVMMWDAGFSDANVNNGCTYAQEVKSILETGGPCGSGPVSPPAPTTSSTSTSSSSSSTMTPSTPATPTTSAVSTPTTTSVPASTPTGTVPQWGQCGGEGYTGPTQCAAPYKCVYGGVWWSSCQ